MTNSSEKFCLKWNDFQKNIVSSYHELRKDSDFCDVTLVCGEDQQIEAHKIMLTACSPFFSMILKKNKHSHPMIYMRGMKAKDLISVVDFIYYGEANIYQDGFLALAEELQLKGLAGAQDDTSDLVQEQTKPTKQVKHQRKPLLRREDYLYDQTTKEDNDTNTNYTFEGLFPVPINHDKLLVPLDTNKEDFKDQMESMMVKAEDGEIKFICTVCQKTNTGKNWGTAKDNMRHHIETHVEGLSYPCNQCGKVSR